VVSKSQQALEGLVCGYGKENRNAKVLVMLKAYFDDSCGDEGSRTMLLAGCVHRYTVWANFSMSWEAALASSPSIRYLHMREARSLTGEFERWKAPDRDKKLRTLAGVIRDYEPSLMFAWLSRSEHGAVLKPVAPHMLGQAYFLLFYAVIVKLAHYHHAMGVTLPVDFVFDDQGQTGKAAVIWYDYIKSLEKPEIARLLGSSPVFLDDKAVVPLQAADMAAWHLRRRKDRPNEDVTKWPTAPLLGLVHCEVNIPKAALQLTADQMKEVPGLALVQNKPDKKFKAALKQILRDAKF
jgi:Protein of unknown function (DUF3800)